jgi:hypothetical protein
LIPGVGAGEGVDQAERDGILAAAPFSFGPAQERPCARHIPVIMPGKAALVQ